MEYKLIYEYGLFDSGINKKEIERRRDLDIKNWKKYRKMNKNLLF